MTDLISRADAIEAVKETKPIVRSTERNWGKMIAEQHSKELVKALKALPSADAEWIPCSERLPKARESVILSTKEWTGEGCYWETTEHHVIWKGYRWNMTCWDNEVTAWMPLPKPYREESEVEE